MRWCEARNLLSVSQGVHSVFLTLCVCTFAVLPVLGTQTLLTLSSIKEFVGASTMTDTGLYRSLTRRIILHIDMDAFYAQVEHRRTGIARDEPLAVQQWEGLIAVNYAARARGISRHMNVHEAKKACPELHCVHVEVISGGKGEASALEGDELATQLGRGDGKVSLGRYRTASAEVFAALQPFGTVEKASIDEAYLDVTQVASRYFFFAVRQLLTRTTCWNPGGRAVVSQGKELKGESR